MTRTLICMASAITLIAAAAFGAMTSPVDAPQADYFQRVAQTGK